MPPLQRGNIRFLPIVHSRLEFATEVRLRLLADPPDVVAVELPGTWREAVLKAVKRLPFLTAVVSASPEGSHMLPVEPTDGIMEALRTAGELGLPVELIDLDVPNYPRIDEPLPDPHALHRLGYEAYLDAYYANARPLQTPGDEARETLMAHALQRLSEPADGGAANSRPRRITCVLGAAHLPGLLAKLETPQPRPLGRTKPRALTLYNWALRSTMEHMSEAPFLAAAYERWRLETREAAHEPGAGEPQPNRQPVPQPVHREAESERLLRRAAQSYAASVLEEVPEPSLQRLGAYAKKYAFLDGLLVPDLFHLVTAARGMVDDDFAYEMWDHGSHYPWQDGSALLPELDVGELLEQLQKRRMTLYRRVRHTRPQLSVLSSKRRLRERYGGRWRSEWSGRMICSHPPEDLVIEDYGRHLRHRAGDMLASQNSRIEPFQVSLKDGVDVRETLRNWHKGQLYVRDEQRVRGRVGSVVVVFDVDDDRPAEARHAAPAPFAASGAPAASRVPTAPGEGAAGEGAESSAGVDEAQRYPWLVTWIGENDQESDMAFYATEAGEDVVGPGISRCEYGGFVMSYPPRRMADVWSDPFFEQARNKPERLLLAALDYSVERMVLYVAAKPPRDFFRSLAGRMGKQLVYMPLGQLDPGTLRKVRHFHVLDGQHVRSYAERYIR